MVVGSFINAKAHSFVCEEIQSAGLTEINEFAEDVLATTASYTKKIVDINVALDGSGSVSLILDEKGDLVSVKFMYKGSLMGNLTVAELNKGDQLTYEVNGQRDPLQLSLKTKNSLSPEKGGAFDFKVLMHGDPATYKSYPIDLKKVDGSWGVYSGGTKKTKIDLDPKLGWSGWTGHFKSVSIK